MASIHAARLGGDDYQHLYSWWLILGLMLPDEQIQKVIIENKDAGSVDDVTVHYEPNLKRTDRFYQIKYHVDAAQTYSAQEFQKELLGNFWNTWNKLRENDATRMVELYLVSNWAWNRQEQPAIWIDEATGNIDGYEFLSASNNPIAKIRQDWQNQLHASNADFKAFIASLYLRLQYSDPVIKYELIVERMKRLKLRTDIGALFNAIDIVRQWIKVGKHEVTQERLEAALRKFQLYLPEQKEDCVTIRMETIQHANIDDNKPEYHLDWVDLFVANDKGLGDHQLKDPTGWNTTLRPQLYEVLAQMRKNTTCNVIKANGWSRISAWFAFGYVFSSVAGYIIQLDLPGQQWRTDAEANSDFTLTVVDGQDPLYRETLSGVGDTVALGISTETTLDLDIQRYLAQQDEQIAALLLLHTNPGKLRNAGDAVSLASSVKKHASDFVKQHNARRLLLFYLGPVGGACFIGHRLNKVCDEIQIMEYAPGQKQKYFPSFLL